MGDHPRGASARLDPPPGRLQDEKTLPLLPLESKGTFLNFLMNIPNNFIWGTFFNFFPDKSGNFKKLKNVPELQIKLFGTSPA
jgi:hypothetical protein